MFDSCLLELLSNRMVLRLSLMIFALRDLSVALCRHTRVQVCPDFVFQHFDGFKVLNEALQSPSSSSGLHSLYEPHTDDPPMEQRMIDLLWPASLLEVKSSDLAYVKVFGRQSWPPI